MIRVLDASKTLTELVSDTSNGLGQLTVMNDSVTEELNGIYELEFDVLTSDKHYEDLKNNRLVKVNVDETGNEQIFRVYNIGEPINLVSHIKCQHITYDLAKVVVRPFSATGAVNIKNALKSNMLGTYPFTTWTDITNTTSTFTNDIPRSFRECLGGYEGSVLDVLRPEYEWNNLQVKICARRGSDHGTRIAYGKNLTDFQQEENNENVYDAVYGYAVVDEVTYQASSIYNKTGASFPKVLNVDFSNRYETGQTPTAAELLQYATDYATNNPIEVPSVNIKISFVPLWQTEEYKNIAPLERVFLGDTVHVFFDKLNVEASARVIKTVWIPSLGRYESIELGSARSNLNTVITQTVKQETDGIVDSVNASTGFLEKELDDLSRLIINGLGLYRTEVEVTGGGVRYILHNKPELADSDVQYYMSAAGIMVSTDYGTTWDAGYDTSTGELFTQALSTIVLKALEIYGSTISFGDMNDKYITASVYSTNNVAQGVSFDGSGTIRMQPQDEFLVNNMSSGGSKYNTIALSHSVSNTTYDLVNYQFAQPSKVANAIRMSSNATMDTLSLSNVIVGSTIQANGLSLLSSNTIISAALYNTQFGQTSSMDANRISLTANSTSNSLNINNYRFGVSGQTVNTVSFYSAANLHSLSLMNSRLDANNTANSITLSSNSSSRSISITNFNDSRSSANAVSLDYTSSQIKVALTNFWGDTRGNYLELISTSSDRSTNIVNLQSSGTVANALYFKANSSGNTITLENRLNGSAINSIDMNSNKMMYLWCKSDMQLRSEGAIRLSANTTQSGGSSGTTQDIHLTGYSLHFYYTNNFAIHKGSSRYNLQFHSDGSVTWS